MALSFRHEDEQQMKRIQREVVDVLLKYQGNTEAALPMFALVRCARVLLRKYPKHTQDALRKVLIDYLCGRTEPRPDVSASGLILPPEFMQHTH